MPHKQVLFRSAAREKILRGATQLCDALRVTLGPKSKSVLIQKSWGSPIVCNPRQTPVSSEHPEEGVAPKVFAPPQRDAGAAIDGLDLQDRIGVRETDPAGPAQGIQRVEQRLVEKTLFPRCRQPPFVPATV